MGISVRQILKQPEIRIAREEFAHWAISLKQRTVQTVRADQPLKPLMDEQRAYVLPIIAQIASHLIDLHKVKPQEVIGYEMGSYAKGTCTAASDLDLNVAYQDGPRIYPFERNLRLTLARVLGLGSNQIHNNDLNMATNKKELRNELPEEILKWRRIRRWLILEITNILWERGIHMVGGIDLLSWRVWAAIRSPQLVTLSGLNAVDKLSSGFYVSGGVLNKAFIFGNRENYDAIKEQVDRAINLPKIRSGISGLLEKLGTARQGAIGGSLEAAKNTKDLEYFIIHSGGYKTAFNLLFVLGFDPTAATTKIIYSYDDYLSAGNIARILGNELRDQLFESIDWLLKARAVISIYASGGTAIPLLGPDQMKIKDPAALQSMLSALNLNSFEEMKEAVGEKREIVQRAVLAAREKFKLSA